MREPSDLAVAEPRPSISRSEVKGPTESKDKQTKFLTTFRGTWTKQISSYLEKVKECNLIDKGYHDILCNSLACPPPPMAKYPHKESEAIGGCGKILLYK